MEGHRNQYIMCLAAANLLTLIGTFVLAFAIIIAPLISYFVAAFKASSGAESLAATGLTAVAELLIVQAVVRIFRW